MKHHAASLLLMRLVAIGRKIFLFVGSDRGDRTAVAYSLIPTCKPHHIEPVA